MILLVGGSGMLGGQILRKLLDRGEKTRALVRSSSTEQALAELGAETILGDLKDSASLLPACTDVSTVITTANSAARAGDDNVETVDLEGNRALIDAASAAGVQRFVFVSAQGESPESPVPFLRAKGLASKRLRESGMTSTVLLPDVYMDVWLPLVILGPVVSGRPISIVAGGTRKHYLVAVHDVAALAVASLDAEAARNRDLLIGGPEPLSWSDVIAAVEQIGGKSVEVQNLSPGKPMPGFPDAVSGLMAGLETYDSAQPITPEEAERTYGMHLTTLEGFLRQHSEGWADKPAAS